MKKFIFAAAAILMAVVGCKEEKTLDVPEQDSIELSAETATVKEEGGHVNVMVSSSADWTLTSAEEYDWAAPSIKEGKDGDVVKFEVKENYKETKVAEFVFHAGKATAKFTITSVAGELPAVKILSEQDIKYSFEGGKLEVKISAPVHYRALKITTAPDSKEWLEYKTTLKGSEENEAIAHFVVSPLAGLEDRSAEITVSAEGLVSATVKLTQLAERVLRTDNSVYKAELKGGNIEVLMETNVEYKVEIAADGKDWLTYGKKDGNKEIFTAAALESGSRLGTVTFTQTNAEEGKDPLVAEIKVSQTVCLISWAVQMNKARLFPKWEDARPASSYRQFTLETLFNPSDFNRSSGGIFTVMGVEGKFLLRFGDIGNPVDHLQLALDGGNYNLDPKFEPNTWYHLAVTYDAGKIIVYVNGKPATCQGASSFQDKNGRTSVNIFPGWSYEPSGSRTFWYGYSYNKDRDFRGLMTEMRAWNRCLTAEEINAPNHFYTVDEKADGLLTYWKFTEGQGTTIANKATGKDAIAGNPLHGETNIQEIRQGYNTINKGDDGIKWVEVSLPL